MNNFNRDDLKSTTSSSLDLPLKVVQVMGREEKKRVESRAWDELLDVPGLSGGKAGCHAPLAIAGCIAPEKV